MVLVVAMVTLVVVSAMVIEMRMAILVLAVSSPVVFMIVMVMMEAVMVVGWAEVMWY